MGYKLVIAMSGAELEDVPSAELDGVQKVLLLFWRCCGLLNAELRNNDVLKLDPVDAPILEDDTSVGEVGRDALLNNTAVSSAVRPDNDLLLRTARSSIDTCPSPF